MKKYSEANGVIPFNWNSFLKRKDIQDYEWDYVKTLSVSWVTCACGNLCESIPRHGPGMPDDVILSELGTMFHLHICNKNQKYAIDVLNSIEVRSRFILT